MGFLRRGNEDKQNASQDQQNASSVAIKGSPTNGKTVEAAESFAQIGFHNSTGTPGEPSKISFYGGFTAAGYGFGLSGGSLDANVNAANNFYSYYYAGRLKHRLGGVAGATFLLSLDGTPIGATTPSTVKGTTVTATNSVNLPSYTVATLPAAGTAGRMAYCSNARMQTATAGTLESSGSGTGGLVTDNGKAWKIAGTNITVSA